MSQTTGIEWTDATWNPTRGCSRVSEGCRNCYAERVAGRFCGEGQPYEELIHIVNGRPAWNGKVRLIEDKLCEPLHWRKPRRIFVDSMSDLFHEALSDVDIERVLWTATKCPQHQLQVLTKRAGNMRRVVDEMYGKIAGHISSWPIPNLWLGVSVENQTTADERIPLLLQTPAAVRFISYEPALGELDLTESCGDWLYPRCGECGRSLKRGWHDCPHGDCDGTRPWRGNVIDWVIAGGESGPDARPAHPDWFRAIRDQCQAAGVPFFFKQWGEWAPIHPGRLAPLPPLSTYMRRVGTWRAGAMLDGREWKEFPE